MVGHDAPNALERTQWPPSEYQRQIAIIGQLTSEVNDLIKQIRRLKAEIDIYTNGVIPREQSETEGHNG